MDYKKIRYTGEEKISSLIGPEGTVEWRKGDVNEVIASKVRNHVKYPYFELVVEKEAPVKVETVQKATKKVKKEDFGEPQFKKQEIK